MRTPLVIVVLAVAVAACSSPVSDTGRLEDDLRAQAEAQDAFRQRLDEFETELDGVREGLGGDELDRRVTTSEERIAQIVTRLDGVDEQLGAPAGVDAEALQAAVDDLRRTVDEVSALLDSLRQDVARLRQDHDALEVRFERHGPRHPPEDGEGDGD